LTGSLRSGAFVNYLKSFPVSLLTCYLPWNRRGAGRWAKGRPILDGGEEMLLTDAPMNGGRQVSSNVSYRASAILAQHCIAPSSR